MLAWLLWWFNAEISWRTVGAETNRRCCDWVVCNNVSPGACFSFKVNRPSALWSRGGFLLISTVYSTLSSWYYMCINIYCIECCVTDWVPVECKTGFPLTWTVRPFCWWSGKNSVYAPSCNCCVVTVFHPRSLIVACSCTTTLLWIRQGWQSSVISQSFCHSVSRITHNCGTGGRPKLVGMSKMWPSRSELLVLIRSRIRIPDHFSISLTIME